MERWANFLVITSTAAATSIGLLFVLITLAVEKRPGEVAKIRLYLTPTVVMFGSVLGLAALLTFPNQSRGSAMACVVVVGALGVVYSVSLLMQRGGKRERFIEASDIVPYVACPAAAYGLLAYGGVVLGEAAQRGLTIAAAGMLALLGLALRNAWAIVVDVVTKPHREK